MIMTKTEVVGRVRVQVNTSCQAVPAWVLLRTGGDLQSLVESY